MGNNIIAKQIIDFHKSTFDSVFNSCAMLQRQAEKMVETFLQQATWFPVERKTAVNEWLNIYNKGRDDFKAAVDDSYKKMEEYFIAGKTDNKAETPKSTESMVTPMTGETEAKTKTPKTK